MLRKGDQPCHAPTSVPDVQGSVLDQSKSQGSWEESSTVGILRIDSHINVIIIDTAVGCLMPVSISRSDLCALSSLITMDAI